MSQQSHSGAFSSQPSPADLSLPHASPPGPKPQNCNVRWGYYYTSRYSCVLEIEKCAVTHTNPVLRALNVARETGSRTRLMHTIRTNACEASFVASQPYVHTTYFEAEESKFEFEGRRSSFVPMNGGHSRCVTCTVVCPRAARTSLSLPKMLLLW